MKVVCPVCNRLFDAECTPYKEKFNEILYYFDTEPCLIAFRINPQNFIYKCKKEE